MYLTREELKTASYQYVIDQITENDDSIVETAIEAGIEEVRSFLSTNGKKEWIDGRVRYDVNAIFSAVGSARNTFILEHTKNVALWYIIRKGNADIIYEQVKERYDRTIKLLTNIQNGTQTLSSLPTLPDEEETTQTKYWRSGSRQKFNYE